MELGMIGLGRMGSNMTRRLIRGGHHVYVNDVNLAASDALAECGAHVMIDPADMCARLPSPRVIWMMLPVGRIDLVLSEILPYLDPGDIIVDGGNAFYQDTQTRARQCDVRGVHYLDVGVSGGIWGLERGYCLMIGGDPVAAKRLEPVFMALAPSTPPEAAGAERGFLFCGQSGSGHFVKMVHNGIEYGMMAALAEGFNLLEHADFASHLPPQPGVDPDHYSYTLPLADIAELWRHGSVISSWLLDLASMSLLLDPALEQFSPQVADSGEGRWTVRAAVDSGVPCPVLTAALFGRYSSRGQDDFANRLLSALRYQFGGHMNPAPAISRA